MGNILTRSTCEWLQKRRLTHALWSQAGTRKYISLLPLLLYLLIFPSFSYKKTNKIKIKLNKNKAQLSTPIKMVLWDTSTPSFQSAGFPNKHTIPCSSASSLDLLACHVVSSRSLDLVTFFLQTCLRWPYCELCWKGYSLPAKVHRDKIQSRHT